MPRFDPAVWHLVFPMVVAASCSRGSGGDASTSEDTDTETSTAGDTEDETLAEDTSSTDDDSDTSTGGLDLPVEPGYCLDPYTGGDQCPDGMLCNVDDGNCEQVPVLSDCADGLGLTPTTATIPVGGVLAIEYTTGADRLWIAERGGDIRRVDDLTMATTSVQASLTGVPVALHFADLRGDTNAELIVGQVPGSFGVGSTLVFDTAGDIVGSPSTLANRAATGIWTLDADDDGTDELTLALGDGDGYATVYWAALDQKPWTLPIPVPQVQLEERTGAVVTTDPGTGREVLMDEPLCYSECGPSGDIVLAADGTGGLARRPDLVDRWPGYRRLRVSIPMAQGYDLVGVGIGTGGVLAFAGVRVQFDNGSPPTWPTEHRWVPGLTAAAGAAFDFDGDGIDDLVLTTNDGLAIVVRSSDGVDGCVVRVPIAEPVRQILVGDLDGDGLPDLAASNGVTFDENEAAATTLVFGGP